MINQMKEKARSPKSRNEKSKQTSLGRNSDSLASKSIVHELASQNTNFKLKVSSKQLNHSHVDYLKDFKFDISCLQINKSIFQQRSAPAFDNAIELTPLTSTALPLDKSKKSRVLVPNEQPPFFQQADKSVKEGTTKWSEAEIAELYENQLDMETYDKFVTSKRSSSGISVMEQFLEFKRRSDSTSSLTPSSIFSSLTSNDQDCLSSSKLSASSIANRSIDSSSSLQGAVENSLNRRYGVDSLQSSTSAEDMLYNLGFSDTNSFLPNRFVKDWMVKLGVQKEKERRENLVRKNTNDELLQLIASLEQQQQQDDQQNKNTRQNIGPRKWRQQRGAGGGAGGGAGRVASTMTVMNQGEQTNEVETLRRRTIDLLLKIDNTSRNKVLTKRLVRAATLDQIEVTDDDDDDNAEDAFMLNKTSHLKQLQNILAQNQQIHSANADQILFNNRRQSLPCMNYLATLDEHKDEDGSEHTMSSYSNSLDVQAESPSSICGGSQRNESTFHHQQTKAPKLKQLTEIPSIVLSEDKQVLTHQQSSASLEVEQAFSENLCKKLTDLQQKIAQKEESIAQEVDSNINLSANVEPAMLSVVLKDVEIGGSRRNSSSNWLQTFSKKNSSSSSPMNLFSPVTVIEVEKLDNVNDSVDSNDGSNVNVIKMRNVTRNVTRAGYGSDFSFGCDVQSDAATLFHDISCINSQNERVLVDVSLQACDGRLSPLELIHCPADGTMLAENCENLIYVQDNFSQTFSTTCSQADFGAQCKLPSEISDDKDSLSANILEEDESSNLIDFDDAISDPPNKRVPMPINIDLLSWNDFSDVSNDKMALEWFQNHDMSDSLLSSGETENLINFDSEIASEKYTEDSFCNLIECSSPIFMMSCTKDEDEYEHSDKSSSLFLKHDDPLEHEYWKFTQNNKPDAFQTPTDNHSISSCNNDENLFDDYIEFNFDPISIHKNTITATTFSQFNQLHVPQMCGSISITSSPRSLSPVSKHERVEMSLGDSPTIKSLKRSFSDLFFQTTSSTLAYMSNHSHISPILDPIDKETQTELSLQNLNIFLLPVSSDRKDSVTNLVNSTVEKVLQLYTNAENIIDDIVDNDTLNVTENEPLQDDKQPLSLESICDSELLPFNESYTTSNLSGEQMKQDHAVRDTQFDILGSINRLDLKFQQLSKSYLCSDASLALHHEEDLRLRLQLLENCIRNENASLNNYKSNQTAASHFKTTLDLITNGDNDGDVICTEF